MIKQNNGQNIKDVYIPYRDSKLTCLLRQSLGGNSTTLMIACLHPSNQYFEENNSTLAYAAKAAQIRNRPVKNDDPQTKLILELKKQVKSITMELLRANQYIEQVCAISGKPYWLASALSLEQRSLTPVTNNSKTLAIKRSDTGLTATQDKSPYNMTSSKKSVVGEGSNDFAA